MRKRRVFFTVILPLLALLVLGVGLVTAQDLPSVLLLQHHLQDRDLRVLVCDGTSTSGLPAQLDVARFQGPGVGVVTETLTLNWSENSSGCYSTQGFGGSFGVERLTVPSGDWELNFADQVTADYWDVEAMMWERALIHIKLVGLVGVANPDQMIVTTTGQGAYATFQVTSTVPVNLWGTLMAQVPGNGAVTTVMANNVVTMPLSAGHTELRLVTNPGHSPQKWVCDLGPCPGTLTGYNPWGIGQGIDLQAQVDFSYRFEFLSEDGPGNYNYQIVGSPIWAEESWPIEGTLTWANLNSMCPPFQFRGWGQHTYPHGRGLLEQAATLVTEPGTVTSPFSKLRGPDQCGWRIYVPSVQR